MLLPHTLKRRAGFSLVELLVVLTIIVLIISISTAGVLKFRVLGPKIATRGSLRSIKSKVDEQWRAIADKARRDTKEFPLLASSIVALFARQTPAVLVNEKDPRVREKYVELKLAQAFPLSFDEVVNTPDSLLPAWEPYRRYLVNELGITANNSTPAEVQRGICLYMALERGPMNAGVTNEDIRSATKPLPLDVNVNPKPNPSALRQQDAMACVDSWGNPLLHTRGYNGMAMTFGLVSIGPDGVPGINFATQALPYPPNSPQPLYDLKGPSFAMTSSIDAGDNLDAYKE